MYSTYNEGTSVVDKIFIRTLKKILQIHDFSIKKQLKQTRLQQYIS